MPGIDSRAPERTETSSGSSGSPSCLPVGGLEARERLVDLLVEPVGQLAAGLHVRDAGLGRDREARRHAVGAEDARHLGDVRALAAEQVAHLARALREVVDVLHRDRARLHGADPIPEAPVVVERLRDARASRRSRGPLGAARARSGCGASASGEPSAPVRNSCASWPSGKPDASQAPHTTPPAAPENDVRWSASPHDAHAGELRREAGGEQELEAKGELVCVRRPCSGCASSSASSLQRSANTPGCGSGVANRRDTASHARAAESSAAACSRRRG